MIGGWAPATFPGVMGDSLAGGPRAPANEWEARELICITYRLLSDEVISEVLYAINPGENNL